MNWLLILLSFNLASQGLKLQEEKEEGVVDYSNIRSIIKDDGLETYRKKNLKKLKKITKVKKILKKKLLAVPTQNDFYSFFSRYWLATQAPMLNWDFNKTDYGIGKHFRSMLEEMSFINRKISVLIVNNVDISHMALPANPGEYIFILSLPFIQHLDYDKRDISLLLLEDMLRSDLKQFEKKLVMPKNFLGSSFTDKSAVQKITKSLLNQYQKIIFEDGFSFSEQYEITKLMDSYVKTDPELKKRYISLLQKVNLLVTSDKRFASYLKVYPSPQIQVKWLLPKKEVL